MMYILKIALFVPYYVLRGLLEALWWFRFPRWGDVFYDTRTEFDGQYAHINKGIYKVRIPDKNLRETIKRWRK